MQYSDKGLEITKRFEGLRLQAYRDPVGVVTIGYGHTKIARMGMTITEALATELLKEDVQEAVDAVNKLVKMPLTQNQFDALVDFTFNLGSGNLASSTLLKLLNTGDYAGAAGQFARWRFAKGKELPGLVARRKAEAELFLS